MKKYEWLFPSLSSSLILACVYLMAMGVKDLNNVSIDTHTFAMLGAYVGMYAVLIVPITAGVMFFVNQRISWESFERGAFYTMTVSYVLLRGFMADSSSLPSISPEQPFPFLIVSLFLASMMVVAFIQSVFGFAYLIPDLGYSIAKRALSMGKGTTNE